MKISIIKMVYKDAHCISDCIESVLNQTYTIWNILLLMEVLLMRLNKKLNSIRIGSIYISEKDEGIPSYKDQTIPEKGINFLGYIVLKEA